MEILMDMDMDNYEDGDTLPLPVVRATETKGGKALMSLFDEPVGTVRCVPMKGGAVSAFFCFVIPGVLFTCFFFCFFLNV